MMPRMPSSFLCQLGAALALAGLLSACQPASSTGTPDGAAAPSSATLPSSESMNDLADIFPDPLVQQLAHAARMGDLPRIEQLLSQGADVRLVGRHGMTVTHWALRAPKNAPQVMKRLLQAGADPVSMLATGDNVPSYAVMRDRADPEVVKVLLDHGISPNWFPPDDPERETSLIMKAVQGHNLPVIKLLVERGANINHVNPISGSALHYALGFQFDVAAYLVDAGIDLSLKSYTSPAIRNPKPKTALEWFCATEGNQRGANPPEGMREKWDAFQAALARRGVSMPCGL